MFSKTESIKEEDYIAPKDVSNAQEDAVQIEAVFEAYVDKVKSLDKKFPDVGGEFASLQPDNQPHLSPKYLICLQEAAELATRRRNIDELAQSFLALFQKSLGCVGGCFVFQSAHGWREVTTGSGQGAPLNYPYLFRRMMEQELDAPSWDLKQTAVFPISRFTDGNGATAAGSLVIAPARVPQSTPGFFLLHFAAVPEALAGDAVQLCGFLASQAAIAVQVSLLNRELNNARNCLAVMQNQLLRTVKMAAVSEVSSGVAHEINNPLQVIMGRVQLAKLGKSPEQNLDVIEKQALRIADIVRALQSLTRNAVAPGREMVDVRSILNEIVALVQGQFHKRSIQINLNIAADLPIFWGDSVYIQQILLNFILNAKKRINQKGIVTISARAEEKKQILFEISDSGPTLSKDTIEKLKRPFTDTEQETEADLDIGLIASVQMIRAINGVVEIEPEKPQGNRIVFILPI